MMRMNLLIKSGVFRGASSVSGDQRAYIGVITWCRFFVTTLEGGYIKHYIYNDGINEIELIMPEESLETEARMEWLAHFLYEIILKCFDCSESSDLRQNIL